MTLPDLHPDAAPEPVGDSLFAVANTLMRHRHVLAWWMLLLPTVMLVLVLVPAREYTAEAAFMPQARRNPSNNLSGLAAQFGLSLGSEMSSPVPLYAELLASRTILAPVAAKRYVRSRGDLAPLTGPLDEVLELSGDTPELRRELAIVRLRRITRITPDLRTGIVRVEVDTPDPELSRAIAAAMLMELDRFNLETRQSQATAERKFTEHRLGEARSELRDAEARLEAFLQTNRDYRNSPQLTFTYQRLDRDVSFRQQLYTTFAQAFEQAKVDEVRDTPVITVVQQPERAAMPKRRFVAVKGLVGVIVGFVIAALFVLVRDGLAPALGASNDTRVDAGRLVAELRRDLGRPWRLFRRRAPAGD